MQFIIGILVGLVVATLPNYLTPTKETPKPDASASPNCCEELHQLTPTKHEQNNQLEIVPIEEDN